MHHARRLLSIPVLLVVVPLICGPAPAAAQGVGLKLYGAYGSIGPGDVQDGLKGPVDFFRQVFELSGYTRSGDYEHFTDAWEAGGDLIFYFSPVLGIGLGAGFMQTLPGKTRMTFSLPANPDILIDLNPRVTAIPVRASLYASIPLGTMMSIALHGGVSYYFARMEFTYRVGTESSWMQAASTADGSGLGFHGGAGLELNFSSNAALVVEATYRAARLNGFTGDVIVSTSGGGSSTESGTLYYWKYDYGPLGVLADVAIQDTAPSGAGYSDVREAEVDLGGFIGRVGFIFRF